MWWSFHVLFPAWRVGRLRPCGRCFTTYPPRAVQATVLDVETTLLAVCRRVLTDARAGGRARVNSGWLAGLSRGLASGLPNGLPAALLAAPADTFQVPPFSLSPFFCAQRFPSQRTQGSILQCVAWEAWMVAAGLAPFPNLRRFILFRVQALGGFSGMTLNNDAAESAVPTEPIVRAAATVRLLDAPGTGFVRECRPW